MEFYKEYLTNYVESITEKSRKNRSNYICPLCGSGTGAGQSGAFSIDRKDPTKWKCFSCGETGDLIDLIEKTKNVDKQEALKIAAELYGNGTIEPIKRNVGLETSFLKDFTSELTTYFKRVNETDYFFKRGFSKETIEDFKLGYDGKNAIIPFNKYSYLARGIGSDFKRNYGSPGLFNLQDLYNEEKQPVFICEGWADALSIYECGGYAISTNSVENYKKLIKQLKDRPTSNPLIVAYDNDESGKKYTSILLEELKQLKVTCKAFDYSKFKTTCKDLNEYLQRDKTEFSDTIKKEEDEIKKQFAEFSDPIKKNTFNLENIIALFEQEDTKRIEFADFPVLTSTLKLKKHDTLVLGADTGAGKSSLALNWLNDLSKTYPILYFNLEMDYLSVAKRLIAINSNTKLDKLDNFKDAATKKIIEDNLKEIEQRQPINIYNDIYDVEDIERIIKENANEHTIVIIDHVLLTRIKGNNSRYERFTNISEHLRQIARNENITMILLCQQNRDGKREKPQLASLKETGSIENDATHVVFIWYDEDKNLTSLVIRKNRNGENNKDILLVYDKTTQKIQEAKAEYQQSQTKTRVSR